MRKNKKDNTKLEFKKDNFSFNYSYINKIILTQKVFINKSPKDKKKQ